MDPYAGWAAASYDAEFGEADADVRGYAERGVPGPLLVLGCGTGRVCRGLAPLRPVVGLDRSAAMLAQARAHPRSAGIRWVEGDLTDFDLGPFAELLVPNGAFNFLPDRRAQAACLAAAHRALPPGAPLTLDLVVPDHARLGEPHTAEAFAWEGRVEGRTVRRTREVWREAWAGRLRLVDRFYVDGTCATTSVLPIRLVVPSEAEWMLEAAGFSVDAIFGTHRGDRFDAEADRLLVRAIRG